MRPVTESRLNRHGLRRPYAHTSFAFESGVESGLSYGVIMARVTEPVTLFSSAPTRSRRMAPTSEVESAAAHGSSSSPLLTYSMPSGPKRRQPPLSVTRRSGMLPSSTTGLPKPRDVLDGLSRSPVPVSRTTLQWPPDAS